MSEETRDRILDAAAGLFARRGYAAVAMRDIAVAAGMSKAGLYHHFEGKELLLVEILERELEAERPLLAELGRRELPWRRRLSAWIEAVLALPPERSSVVVRLGQESAQLDPPRRREVGARYKARFLDPLLAFLEEGEGEGLVRPGCARMGLWILLGTLSAFLQPQARGRDLPRDPATLAPELAAAFVDGIGTGRARPVARPRLRC